MSSIPFNKVSLARINTLFVGVCLSHFYVADKEINMADEATLVWAWQ